MGSAPGLNLKPDLRSTSTMAARPKMGQATAEFVTVGDFADSDVPDRGPGSSESDVSVRRLVSDPPRRFVSNWRGVRITTGVGMIRVLSRGRHGNCLKPKTKTLEV